MHVFNILYRPLITFSSISLSPQSVGDSFGGVRVFAFFFLILAMFPFYFSLGSIARSHAETCFSFGKTSNEFSNWRDVQMMLMEQESYLRRFDVKFVSGFFHAYRPKLV